MRAKESFKFQHEIKQTKETKIPKSKIKFKRLQAKAVGQSKETQTGTVDSGFTLGEAPANTYAPTTYSPLVQQLPELVSPSSVASSTSWPSVNSLSSQPLSVYSSNLSLTSSEQEMYDELERKVFEAIASNPIVSSPDQLSPKIYIPPLEWKPGVTNVFVPKTR